MDECLSENQIAELLSGVVAANDQALKAHLDRCPACLAIVAAILKAEAPASHTRFAIVRRLGAGGMGTVYEALDRERKTRVALKVLRDAGPDTILRFKREFRALQHLHHPNLVRTDELVADGDRWCFTMELLDGVRLLDHVRPAGLTTPGGLGFDDARLRDAFRQLVHGLAALHASGKVHRDVKPSNVLVTGQGRVVLIDLGLVLDQRTDSESTGGNALGTVAYMAPEQALGRRVGPEADWYATGVLLYEALTGRQPFAGDALEIAAHKQRGQVVAPRVLASAIHAALNDLCLALLHPDPTARPAPAEILRALEDGPPAAPVPLATPCPAIFVGRNHELGVLARALEDTRQGRPVIVLVRGESGIGKSALVQRFAGDRRGNGTVVLAGHCYEHESVPFKAVDGIVDALSRYLTRLPPVEAAAVLPRQAALLARAFPVLARVKSIAEAPHRLDEHEPEDLRASLFSALRELLARLADRRPLLLVVDDVPWDDADAFALLAELCRLPDAPALLLVVTGRGGTTASAEAGFVAARSALGPEVRELHLSRMAADEGRALAARLIAQTTSGAELDPGAVAEEAQGHPLFIAEIIRYSHAGATLPIRLEEALWARVAQLAPATRAILQLAALSSGRLMRRTAALAADLESDAFEHHLSLLCAANLVRTSGTSATGALEPSHDRVRAAVLAHTGGDEARAGHRRLAMALEVEPAPDAEAIARHWSAAGERGRATEYAASVAAPASGAPSRRARRSTSRCSRRPRYTG